MDVRDQAMSRGEELTGKWNTPWAYSGGGEKKKKKLRDDLVMLKCSKTKTEMQHVTPCSQTFK